MESSNVTEIKLSWKNLSCKSGWNLSIIVLIALASQVAAVQALATSGFRGKIDSTLANITSNLASWQESHEKFVEATLQKHYEFMEANLPPNSDSRSLLSGGPFAHIVRCTVTIEHSIDLEDNIETALNKASQNQKAHNCTSAAKVDSLEVSLDCSEIIKLVKCGLNQLEEGYERAIQTWASSDEKARWRNAYEGLIRKSQEKLRVIEANLDEKFAKEVDALKTFLHEKESDYARKLEELSIKYIDDDNITEAFIKYEKLTSKMGGICSEQKKLVPIIREVFSRAYRSEDGSKAIGLGIIGNLVNFIQRIPCCTQKDIGYEALYDLLYENNHLRDPVLLIISKAAEDSKCMNDGPTKNDLMNHSEAILKAFAGKISDNDGDLIYDFEKKHLSVFCYYLDKIIRKSYSNDLGNFANMLLFIDDVNFYHTSGKALTSLFDEMRASNHLDSYELVKLAYKVKEHMDLSDYPDTSQQEKNVYENLKKNLPSAVKGFIWNGKSCTIRNRHNNDYLHAAGRNHSLDSDRGRIITWRPGEDQEVYWDIVTGDDAESFTLRNTQYNTFLYAARQTKDKIRRWILHWWPGGRREEGYWKILPVDGCTAFKLKNTVYGGPDEFLYADSDLVHSPEKHGHGVFAWRLKGGPNNFETNWYITCEL